MRGNNSISTVHIYLGVAVGLAVCIILAFAYPMYNVWSQGKKGEAALKRAGQERQIIKERAKAELEAADDTAKAIRTVGAAAKEFPEYRHQEFMSAFGDALTMEDSPIQLILVPTEGQIPILLKVGD